MSQQVPPKAVSSPVQDNAEAGDGLWVGKVADQILADFPNQPLYTCAAGTSPSGTVHFGNFRDVMTSYAVVCELKARGLNARLLFSWDDYDRFRKVPVGIDPSFSKYIGMPLTAVPDPLGEMESYAQRYEVEYEASIRTLGIEMDYRYQTKKYKAGEYAEQIAFILENRERINDILLRFMSDKAIEEKKIDRDEFRRTNYPMTVYSRFTGKDRTQILSYDGGTLLTYRCLETGKDEQIDFRKDPLVKLAWKSDWAMRWGFEQVHFEPSGKDHMTPGGGYDVNAAIAREIFGRTPPVPQMYEFVGIQGNKGKMSGSKGGAVSPASLLDIYAPDLLKWLYMRRAPMQGFNLAFDTEVYRQYDEFDRAIAAMQRGEASPITQKILRFSGVEAKDGAPISFKQTVALGQITQWQPQKLYELAQKSGIAGDLASIEARAPKAHNWLVTYNPEETIALRDAPNADYATTLDAKRKAHIAALRDYLAQGLPDIAALEEKVYAIPKDPALADKELKVAQRAFFKDVYNLLIGKDTGPRLATFLWAVDRARVLSLLTC